LPASPSSSRLTSQKDKVFHVKPAIEDVEREVIGFIRDGGDFDAVLQRVIGYQRAWNDHLDRFWTGRGFVEGSPVWTVPAVPTEVFRHVRLVSSEREPATVFRTSGTTSGARGEHLHVVTGAYDVGAVAQFGRMVMPGLSKARFVMLVFDPDVVVDSSLSHMARLLAERFGTTRPAYHVSESGVDTAAAISDLRDAEEPVVLLTTAFAAVALIDALEGHALELPAGSRVVETGGFKGRSRAIEKSELYTSLSALLGVPLNRIVSEYSMTELSSQLYDDVIVTNDNGAVDHRVLVAPHWCRVSVVSPETLEELPHGEVGILRVVDLANVDSVVAIQTSDMGRATDRGVELLGRMQGAVPRGCSLAIEEIERRIRS
jgi:hypothetical protein